MYHRYRNNNIIKFRMTDNMKLAVNYCIVCKNVCSEIVYLLLRNYE